MKKFTAFIEDLISALTGFPRAERSGIVLIAVLAALALGWILFRPAKIPDAEYLAQADRRSDSLRADYYRRTRGTGSFTTGEPIVRETPGGGKPAVHLELNTADSAKLCTVRGIGPVISARIIRYRNRLGGFVRKEQLKEVRGITEENFSPLSAQFFLDTAVIQKIDINFASANSLRDHPYFTKSMVDRILEARKLKGGWNQLRELVNKDILLPDEAEKVAPYVVFGTR